MKVYKIQEDYIKYLRTKEPRVLENKEQKRPYVGVVLEINGFSYYVPLSSPKPKHKTMKNAKPSYDVLIKMAQLFNITIDSLLMDERKGVYFDIDYMTDEQVAVISQLIDIFRTTNMGAGSMRSLNKQNKELIDKQKTEIK